MLGTTFATVVCRDDSVWGCSCCVMDLIRHMLNEDSKADGEAPAATNDSIPNMGKIDQVAI